MRDVLRCKKDMGFWTRFSGLVNGEVSTIYCRLCGEEHDLAGRYTVEWSPSGVRKDVFAAWNWCSCHVGCCVGVHEVGNTQIVDRRSDSVAAQSKPVTIREILAKIP